MAYDVSPRTPLPEALRFHGFRVYRNSTQSIANVTPTAISWDSTDYDTDGIVSTPFTTITLLPEVRFVRVWAAVRWTSNSTGLRYIQLKVGTVLTLLDYENPVVGAGTTHHIVTPPLAYDAATDTISVEAYQASGGNLNLGGSGQHTYLAVEVVKTPFNV
jgi:hypothetical protein